MTDPDSDLAAWFEARARETAPEGQDDSSTRYRRTPGDALRPDNNAPTTAEGFHKRPSARRQAGTAVVPAMPFAAAPASLCPWERGPRENDREWAFFVAFRDSGWPAGLGGPQEPRNLARLARELGEQPNALAELARTFSWVWRASHYDRDVDARKQALMRTELERCHVDHARIRSKARQLAEMELDKLLSLSISAPGSVQMSPKEVASLLKLVFTQDRAAAGLPPVGEETGKGPDYGALDYAELKQLRDLMKKAGGEIIIQTTGEDVTAK